ncbi:MAG: enoyl-CoA hydratase-related protein [Bacillota bacterium]
MASVFNLIWLFFIISTFLVPIMRQRHVERLRLEMIRRLERARQSRVITMIHRQEAISFLGIPLARFINIEDSEAILRAIRFTPEEMPIDLVLHTPGGLVLATEQIALALKKHPGKVTVFVPHYAMSGGTLLALASDEIIMDENAVLGPVDPQVGTYPAASILAAVKGKAPRDLDDETLILADIAEKAMVQVRATVAGIIRGIVDDAEIDRIADLLTRGYWTHDYPLTFEQLQKLGLPVKESPPREVYALMDLYPQPAQRRPSVQYIPIPYRDESRRNR